MDTTIIQPTIPDESMNLISQPSPELLIFNIVNWFLSLLGLLLVLAIISFSLATIIAAIIEGTKQLAPGQRRTWKKTILFGILFGGSIIGLIAILVIYGIATYFVTNTYY